MFKIAGAIIIAIIALRIIGVILDRIINGKDIQNGPYKRSSDTSSDT